MMTLHDRLIEARSIHERVLVLLLHTELVADVAERRSRGDRAVLKERHRARFRDGHIHCICNYVIGDTFQTNRFPSTALLHGYHPPRAYGPNQVKHALTVLGQVIEDLGESTPDWAPATSTEEIAAAVGAGGTAMVLAARGATFVEEHPLLLSIFQRLGIRILSLVSDRSNSAAAAAGDDSRQGLTAKGKAIVSEAQRLRVAIDASWLSRTAFWQTLDLIDGPVVVSLGNAAGMCAHPANLDDEQLAALAQKGGVIGVHADADTVSTGEATITAFVDHIDYIVQKIGIDHVGIGLNICEPSMIPMETYSRLFPEDAAAFSARKTTRGLATHSDLLNVTAELLHRRYAPDDIERILGGNALSLFGRIWGETTAVPGSAA